LREKQEATPVKGSTHATSSVSSEAASPANNSIHSEAGKVQMKEENDIL
jgi:hypothetical protein